MVPFLFFSPVYAIHTAANKRGQNLCEILHQNMHLRMHPPAVALCLSLSIPRAFASVEMHIFHIDFVVVVVGKATSIGTEHL